MRILAIDPGTTESAWCELEDGKPVRADKVRNEILLASLRKVSEHVWQPDVLAVEGIASYGMAVGKEVFDTCRWIGRFEEAWSVSARPFMLVYRREVKLFLCHSARATDANVRAALLDHFGPGRELAVGTIRAQGPLYGIKGDQWSALAVALTAEASNAPEAKGGLFGSLHVELPASAAT